MLDGSADGGGGGGLVVGKKWGGGERESVMIVVTVIKWVCFGDGECEVVFVVMAVGEVAVVLTGKVVMIRKVVE